MEAPVTRAGRFIVKTVKSVPSVQDQGRELPESDSRPAKTVNLDQVNNNDHGVIGTCADEHPSADTCRSSFVQFSRGDLTTDTVSNNLNNHTTTAKDPGPTHSLISLPSSSSSTSSEGSIAQDSQTAMTTADHDNGATNGESTYCPQHLLMNHRQSLPNDSTREDSDVLGALQERLLYQDTAGRKHSVDSGLAGQRRVPTFVRTYREVAWKRVNKNHGKRNVGANRKKDDSSAACVAADAWDAADTSAAAEETSAHMDHALLNVQAAAEEVTMRPKQRTRAGSSPDVVKHSGEVEMVSDVHQGTVSEYVNGQHIKRGRVPIFITAEAACPRRFSADDLVSASQRQAHWANRGRCLVIKPSNIVNDKVTTCGMTEGGCLENSCTPLSQVQSQGSAGSYVTRRSRQDSADYEFSLDEDDDDGEDEDDDDDDEYEEDDDDEEEDEENDSKDNSLDNIRSENDVGPFPLSATERSDCETAMPRYSHSQKKHTPKSLNKLHRFAMENLILKKTVSSFEQETEAGQLERHALVDSLPNLSSSSSREKEHIPPTPNSSVNTAKPLSGSEGYERKDSRNRVTSAHAQSTISAPLSLPPQLRRTSLCWTLARPVDGTLPVNLEGAVPTGVEFVKVDAADGASGPLWFEKMVFPPGVQVASAQWSAYSNQVSALAGSDQSQQPRRFLVQAEVPSESATSSRQTLRRASDACAPYNRNTKNGVHGPKVATLTAMSSVISRIKEDVEDSPGCKILADAPPVNHTVLSAAAAEGSFNAPANYNNSHIPNQELRLQGPADTNIARSDNRSFACKDSSVTIPMVTPEQNTAMPTWAANKLGGGTLSCAENSVSRSANTSISRNTTLTAAIDRNQPLRPYSERPGKSGGRGFNTPNGGGGGKLSRGKDASVWQSILLSLATEKRSVGVANWLLKGRGGSTVAIDNKIEQAMDLVKRHLMYAVREEVEILKQQIGEMMERIGQLEYENTVLRNEAKPETLSKLLLPRSAVTQVVATQGTSQLPAAVAGGAGGGPVPGGVVVPSASQPQAAVVVVQAQQQQQPPIPSGQQTPATMLPPQQPQTTPSGTSTPTPLQVQQHMQQLPPQQQQQQQSFPTQQQQQQQQLQHLHQVSTAQPGQAPMS